MAKTPERGRSNRARSRRCNLASAHVGAFDGLRHERRRRYLDFAACDVGRGTTNADRGHDASALTRLGFDFASAPHRDTLLDRKAIGRPPRITLRGPPAAHGGTG